MILKIERKNKLIVYIDESIHDKFQFISTAFVFANEVVEKDIEKILNSYGFTPGHDEFKSGMYMANNPNLRNLRENLFQIISKSTQTALLYTAVKERNILGEICLRTLEEIIKRNSFKTDLKTVIFDEDIFKSEYSANKIKKDYPFLNNLEFIPQADSKKYMGIQLADLLAHSTSQLTKDAINGKSKEISLDPKKYGCSNGTLSWLLMGALRHSFLTRKMIYDEKIYDKDINQVIIGPDDDPATIGQNPEFLHWGLFISDGLGINIKRSIEMLFSRVWLGCMH